ncbi:MAG: 16S rRNA (adenine(1518)-N(6)/adenine(1519)-N(6))-dimethyltransferase RsmA [Elusimicrobiota bacterium]
MGAKLGQHFLCDEPTRDAIAGLAAAKPGTATLEIGPGRGAITGRLLRDGAKVTAVELDDALAAGLPGRVGGAENLTVINEDVLRLDFSSLGAGPWLVVGNLPYAVGTPILQKILGWNGWTRAVFMFQKEVAQRIAAPVGGADYGLLSLSVQARADAELAFVVGRSCFSPAPKVDSAVVVFKRVFPPRLSPDVEASFWKVAKAAFTQRRKMAAGVLSRALARPRAEVLAAFSAAGIAPGARPDEIPFRSWILLANTLK